MGREGGRGGGGGGVGLTDEGVAGRTGEEEPTEQKHLLSRGSNTQIKKSLKKSMEMYLFSLILTTLGVFYYYSYYYYYC